MSRTLMTFVCALVLASSLSAQEAKPPVKVFILAGQSNMEGKAKLSLLNYQAEQPATASLFAHWRKDGKWIERDDVGIKFLDRQGKLTIGYGSPNCIGPELDFGYTVGEHYEQPVLLIKTAWGGRSLYRDFRSPSAGLPPEKVLEEMLAKQQVKQPATTLDDVKRPFGASYREMLAEVEKTLASPPPFPEHEGRKFELAGFMWFQGWNDMINAEATAEYTTNLAHFIRDVRRDLKSPELPFVVVQMGVDGLNANGNVAKFKAAQAAVMDVPDLKRVALVKSDVLWDVEAEAVFKKGWRENLQEWNTVGSDYPYHYLGSAKTLCRIGKAMGEAAIALDKESK